MLIDRGLMVPGQLFDVVGGDRVSLRRPVPIRQGMLFIVAAIVLSFLVICGNAFMVNYSGIPRGYTVRDLEPEVSATKPRR